MKRRHFFSTAVAATGALFVKPVIGGDPTITAGELLPPQLTFAPYGIDQNAKPLVVTGYTSLREALDNADPARGYQINIRKL